MTRREVLAVVPAACRKCLHPDPREFRKGIHVVDKTDSPCPRSVYFSRMIIKLPLHRQKKQAFLKMKKPSDLVFLLGESAELIIKQALHPEYSEFSIPKKSGGKRNITAPCDDLKRIQSKLNSFLNIIASELTHPTAQGFIAKLHRHGRKSGIKENALVHLGQQFVFNLDIKNFFPSITQSRILSLFQTTLGLPENISHLLTKLVTYKGSLPQGAPTSPALSNLICIELDKELFALAQSSKLNYSRYADDLTFSGMQIDKETMTKLVGEILFRHEFLVNEEKTRLSDWRSRQTVTGITVNVRTNVSRKYIRHLRAMLHDWSVSGIDVAAKNCRVRNFRHPEEFRLMLKGRILHVGYVRGYDDSVYLKLLWEYKVRTEITERLT